MPKGASRAYSPRAAALAKSNADGGSPAVSIGGHTGSLADLARLLMLQITGKPGEARVDTGGPNRYVTEETNEDQSLDSSQRYPLHRLVRDPTLKSIAQDHVQREKERVRRLFPGAGAPMGQVGGQSRANAIDQAVTNMQRGTPPPASGGSNRAALEAELKKLRASPNFISDPVQKRISEIKALLAKG